ncbi:MAG: transglutaminase domain-containing protein [Lachnospiraceae bacterium]|nr:transglutaminase domain-containing protein [Lachnospiraceae bacterium]
MRKKRKGIIALLLAGLLLFGTVPGNLAGADTVIPVYAAEKTETSITDNKNGTFTVVYDNTEAAKIVVMVTKDGVSYKYYLSEGVVTEVIPMTLGNGSYKIRICKNITGTKYSVRYSETLEVDLKNENEVFTNPHIIVDYEMKEKAVKKATSLCKKYKTDTTKITKIYNYLVKNYSYDYAKVDVVRDTVGYIPNVAQTYTDKMGICYDISSLFAAMLRSQGIIAKVVTGYTPSIDTLHAWNEVYDAKKKQWYVIDVTSDIAYYQAGVSYKMKKDKDDYKSIKYYH